MPIPQTISQNCTDGLQYLSTIDKLYVKHQVKVLEGKIQIKLLPYTINVLGFISKQGH